VPQDPDELTTRPTRALAQSDPGVLRAVATVAGVALLAAFAWWWTGRSTTAADTVSVADAPPATVATAPTGTGAPSPGGPAAVPVDAGSVLVDVRGAVRSPGVQRLSAGARVLDAIEAAGGLRAGRHYGQVNLARVLVDGEQVVVGAGSAAAPAPVTAGAASGAPAAPVDLNSATPEQLETLNGVGPVLAGEIVAWRTAHGRFTSVDDLLDVSGIGDKTLAGLRDSVRVG
jgi:competence protein ComEA